MAEPTPHALEREIAQIEQELSTKRSQLEQQNQASGGFEAVPQDKEVLKEVIGNKFQIAPPAPPVHGQAPATQPQPTVPKNLPPELKPALQELVNMAFTQSIAQAVERAKASGNAALIDAFHDLVVDQLYDTLVNRGILKRF